MKIKYFSWVKDITSKDFEIINRDFPEDINELKEMLNKSYPDLKKHIDSEILRYAINMEYISTNKKLNITDEIAIFPPVSGG